MSALANPVKLTEAQEIERGSLIISVLNLKKVKGTADRFNTAWGDKTPLGMFRLMERLVLDGE